MSGLITVLTDFGWEDPYVAEVKGVLLQTWSELGGADRWPRIIDLAHTVAAGDIGAGAWFLARVHATYPKGTVHLAVVDPGVGTDRPLVAVRAGESFFVGPGNGLFHWLGDVPGITVVRLDPSRCWREDGVEPAPTFHGRDILAPVAARLARGIPILELGPAGSVSDLGRLDATAPGESSPGGGGGPPRQPEPIGQVVWIDRFGNTITDIPRATPLGSRLGEGARLLLRGIEVAGPVRTFAEGSGSQPFWYWGSGDTAELAIRDGHAAGRFGWQVGLAVHRVAP